MTSRLTEVVVDCRDPQLMARFWCGVLDFQVVYQEEGEIEIGPYEAGARPTREAWRQAVQPATLLFAPVPEEKQVKNRLHLDVSPIDRTQAEEVERVLALGARRIDIGQGNPSWVVLADPEGNEFCILNSMAADAGS
jgi:catechol 2,3-dioxygenase-like lactoylglutathione lyase family enzyme